MSKEENLRVRLNSEQKARYSEMFKTKRITQQDAVTAVMDWVSRQEGVVQSLLFGQIDPPYSEYVARLALEQMTGEQPLYLSSATRDKLKALASRFRVDESEVVDAALRLLESQSPQQGDRVSLGEAAGVLERLENQGRIVEPHVGRIVEHTAVSHEPGESGGQSEEQPEKPGEPEKPKRKKAKQPKKPKG